MIKPVWCGACWTRWRSRTRTRSSRPRHLTGRRASTIHIVGGGSQNALLCQLTADRARRPVLAGPTEATALGNVVVQARTAGVLDGTLEDLRAILRTGLELRRYEPAG